MKVRLFSIKLEQLSEAEIHSKNTAGKSRPKQEERHLPHSIKDSLPELIAVCAVAGKWRMKTRQPRGLILVHNNQLGKVQAMVLQWAIMLWRTDGEVGVKGLHTSTLRRNLKKKGRFCKDGNIQCFTCFGGQPEPATEIG